MQFTELRLKGAFLIGLEKKQDHRGFFSRAWCEREFKEMGLDFAVVQSNISYNRKQGTLRGMHYQIPPYQEIKLVRCTRGAIYDVIVDLRPSSATCRGWVAVELSEGNYRMIYVPKGFAHGYQTLEDKSEVFYHVSEFYQPDYEVGLRWNDPAIGIVWPLPVTEISDKDANLPFSQDPILEAGLLTKDFRL